MKKNVFTQVALAALATTGGLAAAASSAQAQTAPPPSVSTRWNGAPETREEDRRFRVNGRFMYDVAATDADCANTACTGTNESGIRSYTRRAFLGVEGRLTENWRYNVKLDFNMAASGSSSVVVGDLNADGDTTDLGETITVPNTGNSVRADDLFLEYAGDAFSVFIGSNNAIAPMEDRGSSLNTPFNERSFLITASGWGKRPGVAFLTNGGNWSLGASLQSNDTLDTADTAQNGTESYFGAARGTWAPIYQQTPDGVTLPAPRPQRTPTRERRRQRQLAQRPRWANSARAVCRTSKATTLASAALRATPISAPSSRSNTIRSASTASMARSTPPTPLSAATPPRNWAMRMRKAITSTSSGRRPAKAAATTPLTAASAPSRRCVRSARTAASVTSCWPRATKTWICPTLISAAIATELTAYTVGATWIPIAHVKFQLNYSSTDVDYVANSATRVDNTIDAVTLRTQFDW